MKKHLIAAVGILFTALSVHGQDCETIKLENKRLKAEIASLRYSTKGAAVGGGGVTTTPHSSGSFAPQTQTDNDISFKVTSVVGNRKSQTVTVTVVLLNRAANKGAFNTDVVSFTGEEGDEFKLTNGMVGKDQYPKTLFTDAPLKATYTFSGILPKVASVKMLPIPYTYYKPDYKKGEVQFRDLPITWR